MKRRKLYCFMQKQRLQQQLRDVFVHTLLQGGLLANRQFRIICFCIPVVLLYSNRNNENLFSVQHNLLTPKRTTHDKYSQSGVYTLALTATRHMLDRRVDSSPTDTESTRMPGAITMAPPTLPNTSRKRYTHLAPWKKSWKSFNFTKRAHTLILQKDFISTMNSRKTTTSMTPRLYYLTPSSTPS